MGSCADELQGAHHEHDEEGGGPEGRPRELQHHLGVGEEDEAGPVLDDVGDVGVLLDGDVAEDGERDDAGEQGGEGVYDTSDHRVPAR